MFFHRLVYDWSLELHLKLAIFVLVPFFSSTAGCFYMDRAGYMYLTQAYHEMPIWRILSQLYASPGILRGVVYRIFMIYMYPTMAKRTLKKIKQFYIEGGEKKNKDLEGIKNQ